jgi:hypothetical protein
VFYPLNDIPASVGSLFVTNRGWDGKGFVGDDGTLEVSFLGHAPINTDHTLLQYIIPDDGVKAGTVFGYGVKFPLQEGEWADSEELKKFDLRTTSADSMLVYCINADGKENFLSALTYNDNGFAEPQQTSYEPGETSVPENLAETGSLALAFAPNYLYTGPLNGTRATLLEALGDPVNFEGSDVPYKINTSKASDLRTYLCFAMTLMAVYLA